MAKGRRRTRRMFLVTAPDGSEKQINVLCYSDEFAISYLERAGYCNIEKFVQRKPQVPASKATWRKDERAIRNAIASLGLTRPVTIKLTGHVGGRQGGYKPTPDGRGHIITVKNYLTPKRAGEAIWHELAHAVQFERVASGSIGQAAIQSWNRSSIHVGSYRTRPCEVEARSYEPRNDSCPLALDKRSGI